MGGKRAGDEVKKHRLLHPIARCDASPLSRVGMASLKAVPQVRAIK